MCASTITVTPRGRLPDGRSANVAELRLCLLGRSPSRSGSGCGSGSRTGGLIGLGTSPVRTMRLRVQRRVRLGNRREQRLGIGMERLLDKARRS